MTSNILINSRFKPDANKDGGSRRTLQIEELLKPLNSNIIRFTYTPKQLNNSLNHYFKGLKYFIKSKNYKNLIYRKRIGNCGKHYLYFEQLLNQFDPHTTIIINESSYGWDLLLFDVAKRLNFPIISLPHNLESLVTHQKDPISQLIAPKWLQVEIKYLKKSTCLFTISREEQWLLRNHGITTNYLPYYPPNEIEQKMLIIREKRRSSQKNDFLMLATVSNPPSKKGLFEFLELIKLIKLKTTINIAGFGLDKLKNDLESNSNINIIGEISNNELYELMITTKALITFQIPSSGALTKIAEFLVAGIPIFANENSARNYFNLSGIHIFNNSSTLSTLLNSELAEPNMPHTIKNDTLFFKEYIDGLLVKKIAF